MKYKVNMYYTETGSVEIKANSEQEAISIVYDKLEESGLDDMQVNCTDREYDATDAELIND